MPRDTEAWRLYHRNIDTAGNPPAVAPGTTPATPQPTPDFILISVDNFLVKLAFPL